MAEIGPLGSLGLGVGLAEVLRLCPCLEGGAGFPDCVGGVEYMVVMRRAPQQREGAKAGHFGEV